MSMNIYVEATINVEATNKKIKNVPTTITEHFNLWQTPTKETHAIVASDNPKERYLEYIRSVCPEETEKEPIYNEDDPFNTKVIRYEDTDSIRVEHEKELKEWLSEHDDWDIKWYEM